ncbi:MAG: ankyrin repeat domain-containing protein [Leptospiraceae bacterium]|nr:ankyrin repeat domain-containing protein [Leptospiraceae bacterium]
MSFPFKHGFLRLLLLICCALGPVPAFANPIAITDGNFASMSRQRPVVAILSLGCDLGSYAAGMFGRSFADVQGVQLGVIDYNSASAIRGQIYSLYRENNVNPGEEGLTLGTLLLIKDGRVLYTTQMPYPGRPDSPYSGGLEAQRRWLAHTLEKFGVPFQMRYQPLASDRAEPLAENNVPVNLTQGRLAHFNFENGARDQLGQQPEFRTVGETRIENGTLHSSGRYDGRTTAYFTFSSPDQEPYASRFTLSVNFRLESEGRDTFAVLGYSALELGVSDGKLTVSLDPSYQRGEEGALGSWYYTLEDAPVTLGSWHNVIVGLDRSKRRVAVVLDGRRLQDIVISDRLAEELECYQPGANFHSGALGIEFSDHARGAVMHGQADEVIIYNRLLAPDELSALYRSVRPGTHEQPDPEPVRPNQAELDLSLLKASYSGDLAAVRTALEAGANVDALFRGWTGLMYAAYFGHAAVAELLMENHADVLVEANGYNAQRLAQSRGHTSIANALNDYSNSRAFYFQRSFPIQESRQRALVEAPQP